MNLIKSGQTRKEICLTKRQNKLSSKKKSKRDRICSNSFETQNMRQIGRTTAGKLQSLVNGSDRRSVSDR